LLRDGLVDASLFGIYAMSDSRANNCVQATPDCAFLFIIGQVSGAPDAERWPKRSVCIHSR
jgi:hypothetical protein